MCDQVRRGEVWVPLPAESLVICSYDGTSTGANQPPTGRIFALPQPGLLSLRTGPQTAPAGGSPAHAAERSYRSRGAGGGRFGARRISCGLSADWRRPVTAPPQVRRRGADGPACRPGSVRRPGGRRGDHPSTTTVAGRLQRSTRALGRAALERARIRCPKAPDFLTLLQVGFAEPSRSPGALVGSYSTVSPLPLATEVARGGLFSVALSRESPRVGVTHHLALWSPDLPRPRSEERGRDRPASPFAAPA
jgi:hypothetical protein